MSNAFQSELIFTGNTINQCEVNNHIAYQWKANQISNSEVVCYFVVVSIFEIMIRKKKNNLSLNPVLIISDIRF